MSEGPIKRERQAWEPKRIPDAPKLGDIVTTTDHPAGCDRWRVVAIPPHAAPSDVADLEPVNPECPIKRARRRVESLTVVA